MGSSSNRVGRGLLCVGVLVTVLGMVGYGSTAMAQQPQPAAQPDQPQAQPKFEEVVEVTGSLIPRPTLEAMSPVATLDPEQIATAGTTRLEDLLTSLPQVFQAQNSTIANGASGTATVDLRYLGPNRTLVLIDGRRMPGGDTGALAADLNFIPAFLVKRIDILTGGASSTYGADAVAGVVNFIMDKDFEGFKVGASGSGYQHNNNNTFIQDVNKARGFTPPSGGAMDGGSIDAHVAYGAKFADGKGHASAYIEYRRTSALLKKRRDYTNCSVSVLADPVSCGGSSTNPFGRFLVYSPDGDFVGDYTLDENGPGNTLTDYTSAHLYNYGAVNFMQRPDQRWTAGAFVDYKFNDHTQGYMSLMLMDDVSDAQIAPSGDFGNTGYVNCDNPLLSADQVQKFCTDAGWGPNDLAEVTILRRNVEGGERSDHLEHQSYRVVTGIKGDISDKWSYDVYGLHGQTRAPEAYNNDLNTQRLQNALIVDGDPNDPTTWTCRNDTENGCVPWNIFQLNGVTQAALDYVQLPLVSISGLRTDVISAKLTGDTGAKLPSATENLQVAVGAEYRREALFYKPDFAYQQGWGAGQGAKQLPVSGSYWVQELYGEALIPLIQDAPGAQNLSLELGYRYSDYSTTGSASTWKAQGSWAPSKSFKFRAGVNRATRAPNIVELFQPQRVALYGSIDPCAGSDPSFTPEQCAHTGVSPDKYGSILENPAGQYNAFLGGNPDLEPETADTHYGGVVITPEGLPGLSVALDYFDIKIDQRIGTLNPDDVLRQCASTGDPALCSLIHRDSRGTLWLNPDGYTIATTLYIGKLGSEGVDVNASYLMPLANSFLNFNLMGTYLLGETIDTGLFAYDCVGLYGDTCGVPTPRWRHRAQVSWETGPWVLTLGWRMQGSVKVDESSNQEALYNPDNIPDWKATGGYENGNFNYFDLGASWNITKDIQVALGINNILDKEPPLGVGFQTNDYGPGFYGFYDPYGRVIHSSINFNF
jgi:iron complex outermembrane receptor protein